jgi:pyruvate/2-oxoglutarate/acetoin dehydrogenase E1 component
MGIPRLKVGTAASPDAAYGLTKPMIRDNGPCSLFATVKMMKEATGTLNLDECMPLDKAVVFHHASPQAIREGKAVTVLTYLHGVKEGLEAIAQIKEGFDTLKPLDMETIAKSLAKTNKMAILDESTKSGGVGATISALVSEELFDLLDEPVKRLCMDDSPVPYASSMEKAIVKPGSDLIEGILLRFLLILQ